jgi:hypothetical protein
VPNCRRSTSSLLWPAHIADPSAHGAAALKRPEQLKERDPAAFGRLLGLDRAPEVKTDGAFTKALPCLLGEVRDLVGERRVTIVFDRGGWSPRLFATMIKDGFDLLTFRKAVAAASMRGGSFGIAPSSAGLPAHFESATCRGAM